MLPDISQWPVQQFYDGKVQDATTGVPDSCVREVADNPTQPLAVLSDEAVYCWIQVVGKEKKHENGSTYNKTEAEAVVSLLLQLKESGDPSWNSPEKIRVITFYQAQVQYIHILLRKYRIRNVTVSTVDSSQGCEADTVILSFVRGTSGHVGFLKDDRRLNVALTRAKHKLICIGNLDAMASLEAKGGNVMVKAMATNALERDSVMVYQGELLPPPRTVPTRKKKKKKDFKKQTLTELEKTTRNYRFFVSLVQTLLDV